jgi:WD domain, G-beta repeat
MRVPVRLLKTCRQQVYNVEFSAAGALLAQGGEEVACWETPTGGDLSFRVPTRSTWGAAFTGIGNGFAVSNAHGVSLFHPSDGRREFLPWMANRDYRVAGVRGGRLLFHADRTPLIAVTLEPSGLVRQVWELPQERFPSRPTPMTTTDQFVRFEFVGASTYHLVIRHLASGEVTSEWPVQPHPSVRTVISPDDHWLAFPSLNSIVFLDLVTRRAQSAHVIASPNKKDFTSLAFHPSGRFLAATSNDATVKLYDTSNWSLATTYTWDVGRMRSVAFSPDGLLAAAGSDTGRVVVWDVDV